METNHPPTADQTEIARLNTRVKRLLVQHAKVEHFLMEEVARLERLNTEERETLEELSGHIDTLCDALEELTTGQYSIMIKEAREAIE